MQQIMRKAVEQLVQRALRRPIHYVVLFVLTALVLVPCVTRAQIAGTAQIQGTVADATGAVVASANVTLIGEATGVKRTTKSDGSGIYLFPNVPVGKYDLIVTATGFKTYEQKGIVLEVGSSIAINPSLSVGTASQSIEVQSEALALQTEDATFKQTIDQTAVTEMPLNDREMTSLITLSGGSSQAPGGDFTGSKYSYQTIAVSIAGGGGNTTLWRFDGGDNQDYMANGNLPYPFPDAVAQFSVESTDLGAQDGGHVGGMVNVVTKSGTNQFHGEAFEFIRNNYIDATNFYSSTPDTLHQNQFGGTFGGPIKRDKMFAFAAYQRWKADQAQSSTEAQVPTAQNLGGNWSVTDGVPGVAGSNKCNSTGAPIQLVDPLTGAKLVGNQYPSTPTYGSPSLALDKYLPVPQAATDPNNCGYVFYAIPYLLTDNQFVTRVDYTVSPKQNIYGRYFVDGYQFPAYFEPTNILVTTQSGNIERVQTFVLSDAYTITSNVVNAAHISILRRVDNRGYAPNDINAATLGVNDYQAAPNGLWVGEGKFTIGGGTNSSAFFNDNTLAIDDDVTWVRGKHQIAFGGEWVQNQFNSSNVYEGIGVFTFNGEYSGSGPAGGNTIGDQNLDFLMGTLGASGSSTPFAQSGDEQNALRGPIPSLYIQDTYHANAHLTLVGGLRWGPTTFPVDVFNRGAEFNMADFLSNTLSTVYPNAPAGARYYGDPGVARAFMPNHVAQFSPNVGASFDPVGDGKTVIRVGAALIWDNPNFITGFRNQFLPPFVSIITNSQTASSGPIPFAAPWSTGVYTTSPPFPQPLVPKPSQALFFPQSEYNVFSAHFIPAYSIQWTLSIQHEFGHGWQAQIDYIGNTTHHDPMANALDPAVFIPGVWGAGGTGCAGIVTTGPAAMKTGAAGTNCSTTGNESSRFLLTIDNPTQGNQYEGGAGGTTLQGSEGTSNYNGLVSSIQHRLSSAFSLLGNWTWSKCMDIADAQGDISGITFENPNNPAMDYGPCGSDYRNIENMSLVARSAFHAYLNRFEKLLVNDWELAPLMHIQSGTAFTVTSGQDNSLTDIGKDRPNLVPGVNPYHEVKFEKAAGESTREYLNPAAFAQVTAPCGSNLNGCQYLGTYGDVSKNSFHGPRFFQLDAQISRTFPIHENWTADFRLEAFNVLNHPDFGTPNATLTSSTFGQVSSTGSNGTNNTFGARVFQGAVKLNF